MIKYRRYINHIFFWSCYTVYAYLVDLWDNPKEKFLDSLFIMSSLILCFYVTFYSYKVISRKKLLLGLFVFLFSFIICWVTRYIYREYYLPIIGVKPVYSYNFWNFTNRVVRIFIVFALYALGYFFAQRSIQKQKQLRLSEQQQAEVEKEKLALENKNLRLQDDKIQLQNALLQSENNFLRAQINPHFLYNCLNFFYSETFKKHPNVAEGILMLSDIMRYSLKDYAGTNGLANLSEEITHIENVINIHRLRFEDDLFIDFKVSGNANHKLIAPMILITMVENVFKHGDLQEKDDPALIECTVDTINETIYFATQNKKKTGAKEQSTGIGLNNIEQRLYSLHQDNFSITTKEDEFYYKKEITIPYFNVHFDSITKTHKPAVC